MPIQVHVALGFSLLLLAVATAVVGWGVSVTAPNLGRPRLVRLARDGGRILYAIAAVLVMLAAVVAGGGARTTLVGVVILLPILTVFAVLGVVTIVRALRHQPG
ncbi:hypothetical protein [Dactylosporangium sp. CS-033363]|uniref:hypothetical protein n=1 Tax=Dactylosporangium sp. CS-033363 TaxID=3239935 RepID=UPI003D8C8EBF